MPHRRATARIASGGYSLAEVLVSLTVFAGILVAVLFVFNLNFRLARGRTEAAEAERTLRGAQHDLVRLVRAAGRGALPHALAIGVETNVAPGTTIGGGGTPRVVAGTDILTVRGVFSSPLLQARGRAAGIRVDDPERPTSGTIDIRDPSPQTGIRQSLAELAVAIEAEEPLPDSLLLASPLDESIFAVVETDPGASTVTRDGDRVTAVKLAFRVTATSTALASGDDLTTALRGVASIGILEEYRFYVRAGFAAPGDETSEPRPQLVLARFIPGSDRPYAGAAENLTIDLADDVVDLQVALGIDLDGNGRVDADPDSPSTDEWLYNDPGDEAGAGHWWQPPATLAYVRLTTVARAGRPDPDQPAATGERLEDRSPSSEPPGELRWRLQSVVDLSRDSGGSRRDRAPPPDAAGSGS